MTECLLLLLLLRSPKLKCFVCTRIIITQIPKVACFGAKLASMFWAGNNVGTTTGNYGMKQPLLARSYLNNELLSTNFASLVFHGNDVCGRGYKAICILHLWNFLPHPTSPSLFASCFSSFTTTLYISDRPA